jgi:hypothetical protein
LEWSIDYPEYPWLKPLNPMEIRPIRAFCRPEPSDPPEKKKPGRRSDRASWGSADLGKAHRGGADETNTRPAGPVNTPNQDFSDRRGSAGGLG